MSKFTTPAERIAELVRKHGSYRKAAKSLGVSKSSLQKAATSDMEHHSAFLTAIGLIAEKTVRYRRWGT